MTRSVVSLWSIGVLVVVGGPALTSRPVALKNPPVLTVRIRPIGIKLPVGLQSFVGVAYLFVRQVESGTSRTPLRTVWMPGRLLRLESMTWVTA